MFVRQNSETNTITGEELRKRFKEKKKWSQGLYEEKHKIGVALPNEQWKQQKQKYSKRNCVELGIVLMFIWFYIVKIDLNVRHSWFCVLMW